MRAITLTRAAPRGPVAPQVEVVDDWPEPGEPGPGELRVRTEASALNHMDLWVGRGIPGVDIRYPHVGGVDGCGIVEAVGAGVNEEWIGRRVVHNAAVRQMRASRPGAPTRTAEAPELHLIGEHSPGTHRASYIVPADNAVDVQDRDPVQAAAFGLTALTAYAMMFGKGALRPGQAVLLTGIGGGVATAALSLARWSGCTVIVTSRHRHKLEAALELGAHHAILDEGQDWSKQVRQFTRKRGVDLVVDTVGGRLFPLSLRSLVRGGAYVTAGASAGPLAEIELTRMFWHQLRVLGSTLGSNDEFREVMALFCAGLAGPVVDQVFRPEAARSAWERLEAGAQMGKLVIRWS